MPSRATHKTSKMIGADGGDLAEESEAKKKKKKERDPLDWEDDKFPKMADRPVEQAQIDPSYLAKMRQEAKKQYIEARGLDPAKVQRTWKFHFGICALENVTQNEWEVFLAVSETGNKFDQFKNRLHGNFQYTKGYKVRGGTRKKFKRMEQVYSKEHNLSYRQMQNHFVTMDVWTVSKLQFNTLLGTAKRSFYDLANDNVYQYIGIKAAGQAQAQKARVLEMHTRALRLDHLSLYLSRWLSVHALGISVFAPASASTGFQFRPWATDNSYFAALTDMDLLHVEKAPAVNLHTRCKMVHVRVLAGVGNVADVIHMSGVEAE
ncbi:unnamed protein product [Symbiodinium sp. CCMP2456]|nr:unnamed protein product [Symbiodinium sp. CCMP2456]